ncbi:MAG: UDP-2,3-diacylglucosamine diphosphatase [Gammaproteobacteria bacterium]|nr:UDP-2,3-diacylglucosamine diphosphatase [Gammaproteobacteria bacterium]
MEKYRSIFISDVHLGTKNCKSDYLLDFLQETDSEYLYLVGDIFDLIQFGRKFFWTSKQGQIVGEIVKKAQTGTRVVYIPGNHDAVLREITGNSILGIEIKASDEHVMADGRRFFVSHGDEFDTEVRFNRVLHFVGDHGYTLLLNLSRYLNRIRGFFGKPYWSLSSWLKHRFNDANVYIDKFESVAAETALQNEYQGYICGHIHKAGIRQIDGVLYCNDGDWVEHCTALTESHDGTLQLIHWSETSRIEAAEENIEKEAPCYAGIGEAGWANKTYAADAQR